jgi:hypothetical protein
MVVEQTTMVGFGQDGDPVSQSMNDKECFDDIRPYYTSNPKNPRER